MKREYLGDSYDIVKRFWSNVLSNCAPLYAEPRFIPAELRIDFSRMTGIPMHGPGAAPVYSLLNDPDTGIRAPDAKSQSEGRSHIALRTVMSQCKQSGVHVVVTFDQSNHRVAGRSGQSQRTAKLHHLMQAGIVGFYYVSHAPFLFASASATRLQTVADLVVEAGIPASRLERAT